MTRQAWIWVAGAMVASAALADEIVQVPHRYDAPLARFAESNWVWVIDSDPLPAKRLRPPAPRPRLAARVLELPRKDTTSTREVAAIPGAASRHGASEPSADATPVSPPSSAPDPAPAPAEETVPEEKDADPGEPGEPKPPPPGGSERMRAEEAAPAHRVAVVHFRKGSARVTPSERQGLLEGLSGWTRAETPLSVTGFTCDLGTDALNDRLARARAQAVAAILAKAGYSVAQVEGRGKANYATENPSRREAARRVEVRPLHER